jgi:peptide/nickel transport system permease protein
VLPSRRRGVLIKYLVTSATYIYIRRIVFYRLIRFLIVLFIGLTTAFIITRTTPIDPTTNLINRLTASFGANVLPPETLEEFRKNVMALLGVDKPLYEQYMGFLFSVFTFKFGPSFTYFPTLASELVARYLPYTVLLLGAATLISWVVGVFLGTILSMFENRFISKLFVNVLLALYPVPLAILSLSLFLIFAALMPLYNITPGGGLVGGVSFSVDLILNTLSRIWLPALTIIIVSGASWILGTKGLADAIKSESFVTFAFVRGLRPGYIIKRYIYRNVLVPQLTALALSLGSIFSGTLIVEQAFSYPGLGSLLALAVASNDHTVILAIVSLSILGVSIAAFLLDVLYPLIDPRIRYGGE